MKNTKLISIILLIIAVSIALFFRFCNSPKEVCDAPTGLTAVVPPFHPDSLHIDWNDVSGALGYRVQVLKASNNVVLKDTNVTKSEAKLGTIPVGTNLTVKLSTLCENKVTSQPAMTSLMSGDGGVIVIDDNIHPVMSSLRECRANCDLERATGRVSIDANGRGTSTITWGACKDANVRYYFIYMTEDPDATPKFAKIINVGDPLSFTPSCGLRANKTYSYTVYPLLALCFPLDAPICY